MSECESAIVAGWAYTWQFAWLQLVMVHFSLKAAVRYTGSDLNTSQWMWRTHSFSRAILCSIVRTILGTWEGSKLLAWVTQHWDLSISFRSSDTSQSNTLAHVKVSMQVQVIISQIIKSEAKFSKRRTENSSNDSNSSRPSWFAVSQWAGQTGQDQVSWFWLWVSH